MTTPVMGWALLVPASPFGGPSKMGGYLLALYGGNPILWRAVGSRIMWVIVWRRILWPRRPYGGSQGVVIVRTPSNLNWTSLGFPAAPELFPFGFLDTFLGQSPEAEGYLRRWAVSCALSAGLFFFLVAPPAAPGPFVQLELVRVRVRVEPGSR